MFAFLSARLRRWVLLAVALPVAAWALDRAGTTLEQRQGSTRVSRALRGSGGILRDFGPRGRRR
jgi:hypothetical protein